MKVAFIKQTMRLGHLPDYIELKPDKWYVMSNADYTQFRTILPNAVGDAFDFEQKYTQYFGQDLTDKTILVFRTGGIGDLLFMTPALRWLKENYEGVKIIVCGGLSFYQCFLNNQYIDELYYMPFDFELVRRTDYQLHFQALIEDNPEAEKRNAYDLFLRAFYIDETTVSPENKRPIIHLTEEEMKWGEDLIKNLNHVNKYRVGFQVESSGPVRTFPIDKMIVLMGQFIDEGFAVYVFGTPRQEWIFSRIRSMFSKPVENKDIVITTSYVKDLRQAILLASRMNLFIAPDSAFIHIAGAFNIPVIGLYGPFPSRLRMVYMKNAIGLNAMVPCSPCFQHGHFPCSRGSPSPCFSIIDNDVILQAADFLKTSQGYKSLQTSADKWRHVEAHKTLGRFASYMKGSGIDIGCGYFKYQGLERLDWSPFCRPDHLHNIMAGPLNKIYDFVFCSFCLFQCPDYEAALINMLAMVKIGGYLLLYEPHSAHYPYSLISEGVLTDIFYKLPGIEVVSIKNYGTKDVSKFESLDKSVDEYALSCVVKKNG